MILENRSGKKDKTHAKVMNYNCGKTKKETLTPYFILMLRTEMGTE
jgi:hypothetical protein